jgi:hypothetical protein
MEDDVEMELELEKQLATHNIKMAQQELY